MPYNLCITFDAGPYSYFLLFQPVRNHFTDVVLMALDENGGVAEHPAHRVVLAAASGYFRQVLTSSDAAVPVRPVLCAPAGVTSRQLGLVLDYLYTGRVSVAGGSELSDFFSACRAMRIFGHEEDLAEEGMPASEEKVGALNCSFCDGNGLTGHFIN